MGIQEIGNSHLYVSKTVKVGISNFVQKKWSEFLGIPMFSFPLQPKSD